jgi:hypothetical protein
MAPFVPKHKRATSGELPASRTRGVAKAVKPSLLHKFASHKAVPLPPQAPLVRLMTRYTPIQDAVLAHLDNRDVLALSKTTRAFRDFFKLVERTQYNINDFLKPFVSPQAFRSLHAQHNVLIAGPAACCFMARKPLSELPSHHGYFNYLVFEKGPHAIALFTYLNSERYPPILPPSINGQNRTSVWWRAAQPDGPIKRIIVVETLSTPVLKLTGQACSLTCIVNFISWNKAYSVFPYHTWVENKAFALTHIKTVIAAPSIDFQTWNTMGYDIGSLTAADQFPNFPLLTSQSSLQGERRIGDSKSWMIPLNTDGVTASPFPAHLIDYASFEVIIVQSSIHGPGNWSQVKAQVVKDLSLKHEYIFADASHERRRLQDRTLLQIHLLPAAQRPAGFNQIYVPNPAPNPAGGTPVGNVLNLAVLNGFVPPQTGWKYYDDDMLELLRLRYQELRDERRWLAFGRRDMRVRFGRVH